MKTDAKNALQFLAVCAEVGETLSPAARLYWRYNPKALEKVLQTKNNFEPITRSGISPHPVPALEETTRGILWRKGHVRKSHQEDFIRNVSKEYPSSNTVFALSYKLNTRLAIADLYELLGGKDQLANSAFSLPQIYSLASQHKRKHKKQRAILHYENFERCNYLLQLRPDETVVLVSLFEKTSFRQHRGWGLHWLESEAHELKKGHLIIKSDTL